MRHLVLRVRVPYIPPPKAGATKDASLAIISIDLNYRQAEEAVVTLGYYSDVPLAIHPFVKKAVTKIPRVEKKPLVSKEVLWELWEACYFLGRSDPRERRSWADFVRAYKLNQSKEKPQRWSEDVYFEMIQESVHGPDWRVRKVPSSDIGKPTWDCI